MAALALLAAPAWADAQEEVVKLPEVSVTATRSQQAMEKLPRNVTVITRAEIEAMHPQTVTDLLKGVPGLVVRDFTGTGALGAGGLAGLGLTFIWAGDIQLFLMGTIAHVLKAIRETGIRGRPFFAAMCLALVVGTATTFTTYLVLGYRQGLLGGFGWYFVSSPAYHWGWVDHLSANPQPPQFLRLGMAGIGAGAAALLSWLRLRFVGWPLHPIGLAIGMTNTVWIDWSSVFIAWLAKAIILRFSGRKGFTRALPFFLGLVLGSSVATGLTAVVDSFLR
jgi:hypothetical protein